MQVSRGGCVLHLSEHHGDGYARPGVELAPWNAKRMEVTDPFGNKLRFNEDL
jgi:hypothetical protein